MSKKWVALSLVPLSTISTALVSAGCQSGFYRQQGFLSSKYVKEINLNYDEYKSIYDSLVSFFKDKNDPHYYKKYYEENHKKIAILTKFISDELIHKVVKVYNENNKQWSLKYADDNSTNAVLKDIDNTSELATFLTKNLTKENSEFVSLMQRFIVINEEIESILKDWIGFLIPANYDPAAPVANGDAGSYFFKYIDIFCNPINAGRPLFENQGQDGEDKKHYFNLDIIDCAKSVKDEITIKYYNEKLKNIDYSTITGESGKQHTHALVNLWNEWNHCVVPYQDASYIKANKINVLNSFIKNYNTAVEKVNLKDKQIYFYIDKDNKYNFTEFISNLQEKIKHADVKIPERGFLQQDFVKEFYEDKIVKMDNIIDATSRIIKQFNN